MSMITINDGYIKITSDLDTIRRRDEIGLIKAFSSEIMQAVSKRLKHCQAEFRKHITDLTYISGEHCEYNREDGSVAYYNPYSMRKMYKLLSYMDTKNYHAILADNLMCNQIIKALVSHYVCPEVRSEQYDDLIAVLLDHIMQ